VLHIDPAAVFGADAARAAIDRLHLGDELAQLDLAELIDWPRAAVAKLAVLAELFDRFTSTDGSGAHAELRFDFRHFCERGGQRLEDHARHEAIHAAQLALDPARDHWRDWPAELRDPRNAAVEAFAQTNRHDVDFHLFLQWLAARGLAQAQRDARDAGMAIGLIADLAVGCDSAGSHAWSYQHDMLQRVSVGAPPDLFNQGGQSWGLTTFSPRAMRTSGFVAFIDMLRAAFAHAGGVRIDHILGLRRLWLVPEGHSAKDGAYLRYPLDDLLRLIALESWRHRAIVIGEDLGTVPAGFRERLADAGLLGIRVLWFERDDGTPPGFLAPSEWGRKVTASTTTHDLPTVAGWWQGRDIDARARIGQTAPLAEEDEGPASLEHSRSRDGRAAEAPAEQRTAAPHGDRLAAAVRHATPDPPAAAQPRADPRALHADPRVAKAIARASAERAADRAALWRAFQLAGVAPAEVSPPPLDEAPVDEALRFVARTRAPLVTCPLEDLIGSAEQPNLPGSTHEYPNWQRRIAASVDELFQDDTFVDRLAAVDAARRQD
jgi:4-alpha-glucanotransferase